MQMQLDVVVSPPAIKDNNFNHTFWFIQWQSLRDECMQQNNNVYGIDISLFSVFNI